MAETKSPPSTPKDTPGYPKSPPPGVDPKSGEWFLRENDGTWVWRNAKPREPVSNPSDAVLVERGLKVQKELRAQVFPTPHDVLDEQEVDWKLKNGFEWVEMPNGKRVLRSTKKGPGGLPGYLEPDLRPRPTDAEIIEAVKAGKIKFPTPDEVRANVALQESLRREDGRQRIAPEAAGLLNIPKL